MQGAAAMVHDLFKSIKEYDDQLVATVGHWSMKPNVSNVIPSEIVFTVDARHPLESVLHAFCEQFSLRFQEIAEKKELDLFMDLWHEVQPVHMDSHLNQRIRSICEKSQIPYHVMHSGAGHDAQLFARVCPTTMLFVPSHGGRSHSPHEYTSPLDLEQGLHVLIQLLYELAYIPKEEERHESGQEKTGRLD